MQLQNDEEEEDCVREESVNQISSPNQISKEDKHNDNSDIAEKIANAEEEAIEPHGENDKEPQVNQSASHQESDNNANNAKEVAREEKSEKNSRGNSNDQSVNSSSDNSEVGVEVKESDV